MSTTSTPPFDPIARWGRYFQGFELSAAEAQVLGYLFLSGGGTVDAVVTGIGRSTSTVRASLRLLSARNLIRPSRRFGSRDTTWACTPAVLLLPVDGLRRQASFLRRMAACAIETGGEPAEIRRFESCLLVADILDAGAADIETRFAASPTRLGELAEDP